MKPLELFGLSLSVLLLLTSCGSRGGFKQPQVVKREAPNYNFRDPAKIKRDRQLREQLMMAGQNLAAGALTEAERNVRNALRIDPQSIDGITMMAIIEGRRGNVAEAGRHYRRAAELAPKRGEALNNYGAWLCTNGYQAESLVWFDRALADPDYPTPAAALANAGGCALDSGQYERAEGDLRRSLEMAPTNAFALMSMARNEYRLGRYFQARAFIERRLAAASADPSVLQLAMQIEEKLGDKAAANRYLQQLRREFPESAAVDTENNPS
ncbi:MAG: type IV pilus biogenesis/stability protein PilW [Xanthomonadaceae bacterium]|jgi:type IV pilus assembly protein PilF|nr:type IV pilus biogenesis/stability protein PilW [Xanthomonadaceae bacterium]